MIDPIVSRVRRKAPVDTSRNQMLAPATNGTTQKVNSASFGSRYTSTAIAPISVRPAWKSVTTESVTRLSRASTSLVILRDQDPRGAALVEADRLALQVGEDADSQVGQGALADPPDEVGLGVGGAPHEDRRQQEGPHHERRALPGRAG